MTTNREVVEGVKIAASALAIVLVTSVLAWCYRTAMV